MHQAFQATSERAGGFGLEAGLWAHVSYQQVVEEGVEVGRQVSAGLGAFALWTLLLALLSLALAPLLRAINKNNQAISGCCAQRLQCGTMPRVR